MGLQVDLETNEESTLSSDEQLKGQIPRKLLSMLAPFQKEGVLGILQNEGRAMLCDEMGLGKTVQVNKNFCSSDR